MTASDPAEVAVEMGAPQARVARIGAIILCRSQALRSALYHIAIRGQLGPSVGYPHDRHPQPPF